MARGRKDYEKAVVSVESKGFVNPHGRILMYDGFEDTPLKWDTLGTGTHFETRQAAAAYNGGFGLRLDLTATVPGVTDISQIYRYLPIDVARRLLSEIFWRANEQVRLQYIELHQIYYDGNRVHFTEIRYNRVAGEWEYLNTGGGWTPIPGSAQTFFNQGWNELTLSVDFAKDEYIVFKSNDLEINLGGIPCRTIASGLGAHLISEIRIENDTVNRLIVDIDDVVVRELEV